MTREDINRLWNQAYVNGMLPFEQIERFAALVCAAEREACAKVLDDWKKHNWTFEDCAAAIRARGEK